MKLKLSLLLMLSSLVLVACSGGGGSGKGGKPSGNVTREDLKRWPESGQYSISFTYNGCTDEYSGSGKAQYCVDLTDESKSKCNTQSQRRRVYEDDCGDDFDERIARQRPPQPVTTTTTTQPPSNGDEPWPTTTTTTATQPLPESTFQKAQKAFAEIGITLEVTQHGSPIDHLYPQDLEKGAANLLKLKNEFAARRKSYEKITLNTYTNYDPANLSLDPRLPLSVLQSYLSVNDQRISLLESTGVFIDLGIDIYGHRDANQDLEKLRSNLNFFVTRKNEIKSVSSIFKTIKLDDHESIQFFDNTLEISEQTYRNRLPLLLQTLKPFADLATKGTTFKGYLFNGKSEKSLQALSAWLEKNKAGMLSVLQYHQTQDEGLEIEISGEYDAEPLYSPTVGDLSLYIVDKFDPTGLNALVAVAPTLAHMAVELKLPNYRLDKDFVKVSNLLQQRSSKLKSLKGKIESIYVSGSAKTDYSYKTLWISPDSTLAQLDKVLNSIK